MHVKELKEELKKYPRDYYVSILFGIPHFIFKIKFDDWDGLNGWELHCKEVEDYLWDLEHHKEVEYYDTVGKLYDALCDCDEEESVTMYCEGLCSSLECLNDKVFTEEGGTLIVNTVFMIPLIHLIG